MSVSEQQLITWSKPVSTSEDQKCQNAISRVTEVVRNKFGNKVSIFLQGSYRNNTNVRLDSDVDIVVRYDDVYYSDTSALDQNQMVIYNSRFSAAEYNFTQFKNDVDQTLKSVFGSDAVRDNKCIKVKGNTYRVSADVVPCMVLRRYRTAIDVVAEGIRFWADDSTCIDSWPEQHYKNGTAKTEATSRMYKRTVRILKNIKNKLVDSNEIVDKLVSSFLIECLVYNVYNNNFLSGNYIQTLRNVITALFADLENAEDYNEYVEVSGLEWLYRFKNRKPEDARFFLYKCWEYAGF